jgi:putative DNA primase/helicase
MIRFVESLGVPRNGNNAHNIKSVPLQDYLQKTQTPKAGGTPPTLCEFLQSPARTKPFFDADQYSPIPYSAEDLDKVRSDFLHNIHVAMDHLCKSIPDSKTPYRIILAHRHRFIPQKNSYKASFRAWITNYALPDYSILGPVIKNLEAAGTLKLNDLDATVYKDKEQLVNSLFCCKGTYKGQTDHHILIPEDANEPLESFVIQHLTGNEISIPMPEPKVKANKKKSAAPTAAAATTGGMDIDAVCQHPIVSPNHTVSAQDSLTRLLHLLDKARWDRYDDWCKIATALKNATGDDTYKELWLEMSMFSVKYERDFASSTWDTLARQNFDGPRLTLKSVEMWAQHDDPVGYYAYKAITLDPFILERWDQGDRGLAEIAHRLLKDVVKCDERCQTFYYFDKALTAWRCGKKEDLRINMSHALEDALQLVVTHFDCLVSCLHTLAKKPKGAPEPNFLDPMAKKGPVLTSAQLTERAEQVSKDREEVGRVIKYLHKACGMTAVVNLAAPLFIDATFEQKLDQIPYLLGVKNGVVDLRTGELRERKPEDGIYRILDIEYDPQASTQLMQDTVMTIMADDPVMTEYLQKVLGYGITGEVSEEAFMIFTSSGRNGKGVVTQQLMSIMGPYYVEMNPAIIVDRQVSNIESERGKLLGSRLAVFNELRVGERLKTNEVQLLSGGDGIPARPVFKDPITIIPRHLCILVTNHLPQLSEVIPAIQQRLLCIKFPVTFVDLAPGEQPTKFRRPRNDELKGRLAGDRKGVFRWLVEGAVKWYATKDLKKNAPAQVKEANEAYFQDQDTVQQFLTECCIIDDEAREPSLPMLDAYNSWLKRTCGERSSSVSAIALSNLLGNKGFIKKKARFCGNNTPCFFGLRLRPDWEYGSPIQVDDVDG